MRESLTRRAAQWRAIHVGALALWFAAGGTALAAPQSPDQQRCLNHLAKAAADVSKYRGKAAWKCVHYATRGLTQKLGDAGDTLSAQACLTNDVGGRVAAKAQHTLDDEARSCGGAARPSLAYAGGATLNSAADAAALQVAGAIFGPNLDAALVSADLDPDGARCQEEVLKDAYRLVDDMWRVARGSVSDGLQGRDRRAGASPDLPAQTTENLESEILSQSLDDPRGKIQDEVDRMALKVPQRCADATTPLAQLFPGTCAGATDAGALAGCIAGIARGHFYSGVTGSLAMVVDCDLTDNGLHDESCISPAQRRHVLDRLAYGPDPYTVGRIQALGLNGYIDEQLAPAAVDDTSVDTALASRYPMLAMNVVDVRHCYPANATGGSCPGSVGGVRNDVAKAMEESEIYRALVSHRQFEAVLVDFWFNHFNVTGSVGQQQWNTVSYLRDSIRPWILGNFEDSILNEARGSAMLDYLDLRENQVGVPAGSGYNENFPRELLELHTMGVNGGYSETDVKEMARALTGWREEWQNAANFEPGYPGFRYQDNRHDYLGPKTILGQTLSSSGEMEGLDAISLAVRHPSTATFICSKLLQHFIDDDAPYAMIDRCAASFIALQDDPEQLKKVTEQILKSKEFQLFPEYRHNKVKKPVVLLFSLFRAVGANPDPAVLNYKTVRQTLINLGERIRNADPPTGYPDRSIFWSSPGAMVQYFNIVESNARTYGPNWGVAGSGTSAQVVDAVTAVLFPVDGVSTATRNGAIAYLDSIAGTPAQRVAQAGAFLLSSRDFLTY